MNIKPNDLHFALPKIMEPALSQFNQQNVTKQIAEQDQAIDNMAQSTEESLQKSNAVDPAIGEMIQDGQSRQNGYANSKRRKRKQSEPELTSEPPQAKDPFKGKHIDFKA